MVQVPRPDDASLAEGRCSDRRSMGVCVGDGPHACPDPSLFSTEIGLEDLGTERTCLPVPKVEAEEVEKTPVYSRRKCSIDCLETQSTVLGQNAVFWGWANSSAHQLSLTLGAG